MPRRHSPIEASLERGEPLTPDTDHQLAAADVHGWALLDQLMQALAEAGSGVAGGSGDIT
jgi:hypothetical protein